MSRIVLVESAPGAPGLLGFAGWQALTEADVVLLRDPEAHPAWPHLERADLPVEPIPDGLRQGVTIPFLRALAG